MKRDGIYHSGQVCRAYGINNVRLHRLIKSGRVKPRKPGRDNIFTEHDFLQVGLVLALDAKGVHRTATATVCDYVRSADLSIPFANGQTLMVIYGEHAFRQLATPKQLAATLTIVQQRHGDAFQWDKCKIIDLAGALAEVHRMIARVSDDTEHDAEHDTEHDTSAMCISE